MAAYNDPKTGKPYKPTTDAQYVRDFLEAVPGGVRDTVNAPINAMIPSLQTIKNLPSDAEILRGAASRMSGDAPIVAPSTPAQAPPAAGPGRYVRSMSEGEFNQGGLGSVTRDPNAPPTSADLKSAFGFRDGAANPAGDAAAIANMRAHRNIEELPQSVRHIVDSSMGQGGGEWVDSGPTPTRAQSQAQDEYTNLQMQQGRQQQARADFNIAADRDAEIASLERAQQVAKAQQDLVERDEAIKFAVDNHMPQNKDTIKMVMALNRSEKTKNMLNTLSKALKAGVIDSEEYDRQFAALNAINAAADPTGVKFANKPDVPGTGFAGQ